MSDCDHCDLDEDKCRCYIYNLEKRIDFLEEGLDQLTEVVKKMSDYIREKNG